MTTRRHRTTHRLFVLAATAMLLTGMLATASAVLAVHDEGIFQLEGNPSTADQSTPPAAEDWDLICKAHLSTATPPGECIKNPGYTLPAGTTTSNPSVFVADVFGSGTDDIFTSGGSKDDLDISSWKFKNAQPSPDKDDLEHAFAAEYTCTTASGCTDNNGDKFIYFGADRFTNEGDANIAFWFLQAEVGENGNGATPDLCTSGSGCGFTGTHVAHGAGPDGYICYPGQTGAAIIAGGPSPAPNCTSSGGPGADDTRGDVLIVSAFTNGGAQPNITVYEWVGTGKAPNALKINAAKSLVAIPIPGQVGTSGCATANLTEDAACAIVNPGGETTPWTFSEKADGQTNEYQASELYEGGLNLSALGLAETCFSTFLVNTRSSQSVDATLKDFALGNLGRCGSSLVTTPKSGGANVPAGGLSIGAGTVGVTDSADLQVTGIANWNGTLKFFLCGPVAAPATCDTGGTQVGPTQNVTQATANPMSSVLVTVTSAGRFCFRAEFDSNTTGVPDRTDGTAGECFTVNPVTPTLVTQASGAVALGQKISDTATLSNAATQPTAAPVFNTTGTAGAAAGGTISFTAYGPDSCSTVAFGPVTINVSGNGAYGGAGSAAEFTPTAAGQYVWVASYSGNLPNTNAVPATACDQQPTAEKVTVTQTQITTTPSVYPNDSATITVANGAAPSGSVTFRLYPSAATCGTDLLADRLFSETVALPAGASLSKTVGTHNGDPTDAVNDYSHTGLADTTLYWRVTYGNDPNHQGRNSLCLESTRIDNNADTSGGTAP